MSVTIKAVILDFDDTLCPTEAAGFAMENEALRLMGRPAQGRTVHQQTWGQSVFDAIRVRSPGIDAEQFRSVIEKLWPRWVAEGRMDAVPAANLRALDALVTAGYELYLLTSRTQSELRHILAPDHELASRIRAFYHGDMTRYHKPDPRVFDAVFLAHGLRPAECVYVGDTPSDAQAAKGAGMYFIATLESGLRTAREFAPHDVDATIACFGDLPAAVAATAGRAHGRAAATGRQPVGSRFAAIGRAPSPTGAL